MTDAHALARLVGEVDGFLDEHWGRSPSHVAVTERHRGPVELLTLDDVDRLVASSGLRAPSFRLVKRGRTLPQSSVTRNVRIGSRPVPDLVDVAAVHREVGNGATLVLQGLHRSFAPIVSFCRDLEQTLTHPVQANAYLTPPVAQGLDLHEDPHDVFAVQTYGTKRWVVHPPDGSEPWDLQLEPGDVLYLPAGTRHAAQTVGEASLHLTLGVRTITWRHIVERAVAEVVASGEGLDRPLPAAWAEQPHVLEAELTVHLAELVARLGTRPDLAGLLDREADRFRASRTPDLTGGLRDLMELEDIDDRTRLRRRDRVSAHVVDADDHVEVVLADRRLRMPTAVAPALGRLVAPGGLRPADLDDLMDAQSRLVLCRRLVREGLLTVERADGGSAGG